MEEVMLTTTDNPFNPFTEFELWLSFDEEMGYNTLGYIARLTNTSINLPDEFNEYEIERAMDRIIELNVFGVHKKVKRSDYKIKTDP